MSGKVKVRSFTMNGSTAAGWQVYQGAGLLTALVLDYTNTSGAVLTGYDGQSASGIQVYTRTSDTDAGTTVPITCYTDGDLVAGTSTANVKAGIPFSRGLWLALTGDTNAAHTLAVTAFIKPLINKSVQVRTAGSAGSAVGVADIFDGPGILHGIRVRTDPSMPSTLDFLLKDSHVTQVSAGTGSGNTILTKTDYGMVATDAIRPVVTTTGSDEAGNAVSTAATGAYASMGIHFVSGLNVSVQQANAADAALILEALIEA